ncbi:metallophosphoesterase [Candidatus Micrarchaeota archaeon]|nr:metallophosphoesterase [Candidatus Micrarchaeota archaeon]
MIRIAFISDVHFGFHYGSPTGEDSFRQAGEAFDLAVSRGADLIVIPGDLFDSRVPRQEVWAEALRVLQKPLLATPSRAKFAGFHGRETKVNPIAFRGIPVVAVHGTHERRGGGAINPLHILHEAGYLIHLHCNTALFDVGGERIAVHGFSGVPEHYAAQVVKQWNPQPLPGMRNIVFFHQNVKGYLYAGEDEEAYVNLSDFAPGFDLIVDGHIHSPLWEPSKRFLIVGSTVMTQQNKSEASSKKGIWLAELGDGEPKMEFAKLETQRPFFLKELTFEGAEPKEVLARARKELEQVMAQKHSMKPFVRLKLSGSLKQGVDGGASLTDEAITSGFDAFINVARDFDENSFRYRIAALREKQQAKLTPEERGLRIVDELLSQNGYKGIPPEEIIEPLSEGDADAVVRKVLERVQKNVT